MSSWNLDELRKLIEEMHGVKQLEKARPHINAVDWKLRAGNYHSYTASNAFSGVIEEEPHPVTLIKMMLSSGEEVKDFHEAQFIYETNIIACAQSMHSVADIISHVIQDSLALEGVDEEKINLKVLKGFLSDSPLKKRITRVLGLAHFRYLQDFVNTSKHIRLVDTEYTLDFTGKEEIPYGVRFREFKRMNRTHRSKWGRKFLDEMKQLSVEYILLGSAINEHLTSAKS